MSSNKKEEARQRAKVWYENNREHKLRYQKEYRKKNLLKVTAYQKLYLKKYPERREATQKKYYQAVKQKKQKECKKVRFKKDDEAGVVLIEFAILLPILILLLALFVDVGFWLFQLNRAQTGANASAQAGAYHLPDEAEALARAYQIANLNGFDSDKVSIEINDNAVTVIITEEGFIFFSGIITQTAPQLKGVATFSGKEVEQ